MSRLPTPDTNLEHGAIYTIDFQRILVTCEECGNSFMMGSRGTLTCKQCNAQIAYESRQTGARPHVILGHEKCLEHESTVVAVPLSTSQFASMRPWAVKVEPTSANGLDATSYVLPTKIRCVNKTSIFEGSRRGKLSQDDMKRVEKAIATATFG